MENFFIYTVLGVILFIVIFGIRIIRTQEVAIVEFLGKFNRVLHPGFNIIVPIFERIAKKVGLRTEILSMSVDSVSKDNVKITVGIDVFIFVKNEKDAIYKSYYSLQNPRGAIQSIVDNALRAKINEFQHLDVLSKRNEFSDYLEEILVDKLSQWGFTMDSVQITEINLPNSLIDAMNNVKTSERQKEAAENQGEAKKILSIKEAEADQESQKLRGLGLAQQREEVAKGLKRSVDEFRQALGEKSDPNEIMNIILMTNYFDALKDIGQSNNTKILLMDNTPEAISNIRSQIIKGIESSK